MIMKFFAKFNFRNIRWNNKQTYYCDRYANCLRKKFKMQYKITLNYARNKSKNFSKIYSKGTINGNNLMTVNWIFIFFFHEPTKNYRQ